MVFSSARHLLLWRLDVAAAALILFNAHILMVICKCRHIMIHIPPSQSGGAILYLRYTAKEDPCVILIIRHCALMVLIEENKQMGSTLYRKSKKKAAQERNPYQSIVIIIYYSGIQSLNRAARSFWCFHWSVMRWWRLLTDGAVYADAWCVWRFLARKIRGMIADAV